MTDQSCHHLGMQDDGFCPACERQLTQEEADWVRRARLQELLEKDLGLRLADGEVPTQRQTRDIESLTYAIEDMDLTRSQGEQRAYAWKIVRERQKISPEYQAPERGFGDPTLASRLFSQDLGEDVLRANLRAMGSRTAELLDQPGTPDGADPMHTLVGRSDLHPDSDRFLPGMAPTQRVHENPWHGQRGHWESACPACGGYVQGAESAEEASKIMGEHLRVTGHGGFVGSVTALCGICGQPLHHGKAHQDFPGPAEQVWEPTAPSLPDLPIEEEFRDGEWHHTFAIPIGLMFRQPEVVRAPVAKGAALTPNQVERVQLYESPLSLKEVARRLKKDVKAIKKSITLAEKKEGRKIFRDRDRGPSAG